jgi:predicted GIY-YIG superfamily endonuclease
MENPKVLIYKLTCNVTNKVYYGSTKNDLNMRINSHRSSAKRDRGCRSKEILENCDFKSEILEEVDLENRFERESYYIKNFECVNKHLPGRTRKEWLESCKEKRFEQMKKYREQNKEQIVERRKIKFSCECGSIIRKDDKARHMKSKKHIDYLNKNN